MNRQLLRMFTAAVSVGAETVLALNGIGIAQALSTAPMTSNDLAHARSAFEEAMAMSQSVAGADVPAGQAITQADLSAMTVRGTARLRRRFMGAELAAQLSALTHARNMNASPQFRSVGGSADHFVYSAVERIDSAHVSLAGHFTAHSTVFLPDQKGTLVEADPSNVLNFTATMAKDASRDEWFVTSYDWTFAPGSEP